MTGPFQQQFLSLLLLFLSCGWIFSAWVVTGSENSGGSGNISCSDKSIVIQTSIDDGVSWHVRGTFFPFEGPRFSPVNELYWTSERLQRLKNTERYLIRALTTDATHISSTCSIVSISLSPCALIASKFKEAFRIVYDDRIVYGDKKSEQRVELTLVALQWGGELFSDHLAASATSTNSSFGNADGLVQECERSDKIVMNASSSGKHTFTVSRFSATEATGTPRLMTQTGWSALQAAQRDDSNGKDPEATVEQKTFIQKYWFHLMCFMIGWSVLSAFLSPPQPTNTNKNQ